MHANETAHEPQTKKRRIEELKSSTDALSEIDKFRSLLETKLNQDAKDLETSDSRSIHLTGVIGEDDYDISTENEIQRDNAPKFNRIKVTNQEEADAKTNNLTEIVEDGFKCLHCGFLTKWKPSIKIHIGLHFDGLSFECKYCDKVFPNKRSLYSHTHIQHKRK